MLSGKEEIKMDSFALFISPHCLFVPYLGIIFCKSISYVMIAGNHRKTN